MPTEPEFETKTTPDGLPGIPKVTNINWTVIFIIFLICFNLPLFIRLIKEKQSYKLLWYLIPILIYVICFFSFHILSLIFLTQL
jgi:hypothetical protein